MSDAKNTANQTAELDPTLASLKGKLRAAWEELEAVFSTHSGTKNGTTVLQAEYLDVSAIRR